ncbi:MAG: tyrosine-type recombinase/integrase [Chloroflexota bacterium]
MALSNPTPTHAHRALFLSCIGMPFGRNAMRQLCHSVGQRAGTSHLHPHRLRHTFAADFLRNGGNLRTLQGS